MTSTASDGIGPLASVSGSSHYGDAKASSSAPAPREELAVDPASLMVPAEHRKESVEAMVSSSAPATSVGHGEGNGAGGIAPSTAHCAIEAPQGEGAGGNASPSILRVGGGSSFSTEEAHHSEAFLVILQAFSLLLFLPMSLF